MDTISSHRQTIRLWYNFLMLAILLLSTAFLTNITEIAQAIRLHEVERPNDNRDPVDFTATVTFPTTADSPFLGISDNAGSLIVLAPRTSFHAAVKAGDIVRLRGYIWNGPDSSGLKNPMVECTNITVISHAAPKLPVETTIQKLRTGVFNNQLVSLDGTLQDVVRQEIDPDWYDLVLSDGSERLCLLLASHNDVIANLRQIVGARVRVTGLCHPRQRGARRMTGLTIQISDLSSIDVLLPPTDIFRAPTFDQSIPLSPDEIYRLGLIRTSGRVVAVWDKNRLLLKGANGGYTGIELADENPLPRYGEPIEAVGFAETDLFSINLCRAVWRKAEVVNAVDAPPMATSIRDLMTDKTGQHRLNPKLHGRTVSVEGTIVGPVLDGRFSIEDQGLAVRIDMSALCRESPSPVSGSRIRITGTYVLDSDRWQPFSPFPRLKGFTIVPRTPTDLEILAHPPWWTPNRLLAVIISMLTLLLVFAAWIRILRRIVDRRGHELYREEIRRAKTALRVDERTRLAVELHDSLSQTLTGVSFQLDAAEKARRLSPNRIEEHLSTAKRTLESCREELRICLWDLRNRALEIDDVNEAIRQTVAAHVGDATLHIRFNIRRSRLSDTTMHAILRIIRELAANAVRHGHATQIRIAGSAEKDQLLFSVSDNGTGFPAEGPSGTENGHFGLSGIRERLASLNGRMVIQNNPRNGAKVTIFIRTQGRDAP